MNPSLHKHGFRKVFAQISKRALLLLVLCLAVTIRAATGDATYTVKVSQAKPFHEALVWVGTTPPSEAESKELWKACENSQSANAENFERFVQERPNSPWTPSVLEGLAYYYQVIGRYTAALDHWQTTWDMTHHDADGEGKKLANLTLVNWTSLLAKLGRTDKLAQIFKQAGHRSLETVTLQKQFNTTVQALEVMRKRPGVSYRCGTYALAQVGRATHQLDGPGFAELVETCFPPAGFSMLDLMGFVHRFNLDLVPVLRPPGDDTLIVPSVIHWNQDHYAAIVALKDGLYHVVDPTFGNDKWLSGDVINAEASGHFFVATSQKKTNWGLLSSAEASTVFGKGVNNSKGPPPCPCTNCPCPPGSGPGGGPPNGPSWAGPDSCSSCGALGMATWRVAEPYIELWVTDNPLSYAPSRGQDVRVIVDYHENETRPVNTNIFSFGPDWNCSWLTYMDVTDANNSPNFSKYTAEHYGPMGGETLYEWDDLGPDPRIHSAFSRILSGTNAIGFKITYPDGARATYGLLTNVSSLPLETRAFLTQWISPEGYTNLLQYKTGANILLTNVVDVDGRGTSLLYSNNFPTQVSQVVSPYASSHFYYASNGILTNIVDAAGISSQFQYVWSNGIPLMTNMSTPYGATAFAYLGPDVTMPDETNANNLFIQTNSPDIDAAIRVTEPTGGTSLFLYQDNTISNSDLLGPNYGADGLDGYYSDSPFSSWPYFPCVLQYDIGCDNGVTLCCNEFMESRNSFYWGPLQCSRLSTTILTNLSPNDYLLARVRNWLHGSRNGVMFSGPTTVSHTLNMERASSRDGVGAGPSTWYGYGGKLSGDFAEGTNAFPSLIVQPEPDYNVDGNVRYSFYAYNPCGNITTNISSYGLEIPAALNTYFPQAYINALTNLYTYATNVIDLTSITLFDGLNVVVLQSNQYNAFHQVTNNYDAFHQQTTYVYNTNQQLSSKTTPAGLTTTYTYYSSNFLQKVTDVQISRVNSYTWANGQVYQHTNELGLVETYSWDPLRRLTGKTFSDGTSISNVYSIGSALPGGTGTTLLDVTGTKDRLGNWTSFGYNGVRQRAFLTDPLNHTTYYNYCACGALLSVVDAAGGTNQFLYNDAGQVTNHSFPDGSYLITSYDVFGQATNTLDSAGVSVTNYYDNQGFLDASTNAAGLVFARFYDIRNRITNSVDQNGVVVSSTYDNLDRLLTRKYPDGGIEKFGYSAAGLIIYINQLGYTNGYTFDAAMRKIGETNAIQAVTQYAYDPASDLTSLTDGDNHTTKWGYDLFGRVTNKVDATSTTILTYQYDANNRLTNRWSLQKTNTAYAYDAVGNLKSVTYPASHGLSFGYDAMNRTISMSDGIGTTMFTYTPVGLLQSETGPWANDTVAYTYVDRLRRSLSVQQPTSSAWSESYGYDGANRLTNVTSPAGAFTYVYDPGLGGNTTSSALVDQIDLPTGADITNTFDHNGRQRSSILMKGASALDSYARTFNSGNEVTGLTRTSGTQVGYSYDGIGELKADQAWDAGGFFTRWNEQLEYAYDLAGNLVYRTNNTLIQNFSVSANNELTQQTNWGRLTVMGTTTSAATNVTVGLTNSVPIYTDASFAATNMLLANSYTAIAQDNVGRRATNTVTVNLTNNSVFKYDLNGNLTNDGLRNFVYDDENELVVALVTNQWMSQFQYDGKMRRRIRKEFTWTNSAWAQTNLVYYVYDGNLVIQERDQNNLPNVTYTRGKDLSGSFEGAGGIGGLLARTDATINQTAFYHAENNGNVTMLINSSNAVVAKYLYDAFGNLLSKSGSLCDANLYRFSSKETHTQSGLDYYLYRFYDPNLQRWPNRDPFGESGFENLRKTSAIRFRFAPALGEALEGLNLFEFVRNQPTTSFDTRGLRASEACAAAQAQLAVALEMMDEDCSPLNMAMAASASAWVALACKDPPAPPPCPPKIPKPTPPGGPDMPPVFFVPILEGIEEWWWVVFA